MLRILIPKQSYDLSGAGLDQSEIEILKSQVTYTAVDLNNQTFSLSDGYLAVFGENAVDGFVTSIAASGNKASISRAAISELTLSGLTINVSSCDQFLFDGLQSENWTPAEYNNDVSFDTNWSATGQFLGRKVERKSRRVSINPISFNMEGREQEILNMIERMRETPIYVHALAPNADFVYYGWVEEDPTISYLADDHGYAIIKFDLRVAV